MNDKIEGLKEFVKLCRKSQISKNLLVIAIMTDHRREFDQDKLIKYSNKNEISYNFSAPMTPQQNGIVERKIEH